MRTLTVALAAGALVVCSPPVPRGGAHIDYLQVIRFGGITYLAQSPPGGRPLTAARLGPIVGTVKTRLTDLNDPSHQLRDGDAAYLPVGTHVYQVRGYRPQFRLSAFYQARWWIYEAFENPSAIKGADLLDIGTRVLWIGIDDPQQAGRPVGSIDSGPDVERLVDLVLHGAVDPTKRPAGATGYDLIFVMKDGTVSRRTFFVDSDMLAGGIQVPAAFAAGITAAVANPPAGPIAPAAAIPGRTYAYRLHTHCGRDWRTRFDGTYWDLLSGSDGPIGDPFQDGTMTLADPNTARFDFGQGAGAAVVIFTRHPPDQPLKPPVACG